MNEEPEFKLEGIAYVKSEVIIIAAQGYDEDLYYREFLGKIIHEFCHFAIHETFGNGFKPYYCDDDESSEKWLRLAEAFELNQTDDFPLINDVFKYDRPKWIDELVVRYPQFHVMHFNDAEKLAKFEISFEDLSIMYKYVEKQFNSEFIKTASLRSVNQKSLLGDKESKLYVNSLEYLVEMEFEGHRQIVKTNQTYLGMKNINDTFKHQYNFKSTFMFIDVDFIENDDNLNMVEDALQCRKISSLIVDCHSSTFSKDADMINKMVQLFETNSVGRIILFFMKVKQFRLRWKLSQSNLTHLT